MLRLLTAEQLDEWAKFYALEPWGFGIEDSWNGLLASTVAAAAGAKGPDGGPPRASDFMLGEELDEAQATENELVIEHLQRIFGPPAPAATSTK